jgi:hypothetical protein
MTMIEIQYKSYIVNGVPKALNPLMAALTCIVRNNPVHLKTLLQRVQADNPHRAANLAPHQHQNERDHQSMNKREIRQSEVEMSGKKWNLQIMMRALKKEQRLNDGNHSPLLRRPMVGGSVNQAEKIEKIEKRGETQIRKHESECETTRYNRMSVQVMT